jgi:SAM-dependent methyltransferase
LNAVTHRPYKLLADYYDLFFTAHLSWYRRARLQILEKILLQARSACDLASGTGTTATELARRGIKVFAVDLSPAMCRLTRAKAQRAGTPVSVYRADTRTFRLPEPVGLIACEYDAIRQQPDPTDWEMLVATTGERPLGLQVAQLLGVIHWLRPRTRRGTRSAAVPRAANSSSEKDRFRSNAVRESRCGRDFRKSPRLEARSSSC